MAEWLARKSPCDEIGADALDVSDVAEVWDCRPGLFEDFAGIRFYFTEGDCFVSDRLRRQSKAADSTKEVEMSATVMGNKSLERIAAALGSLGITRN